MCIGGNSETGFGRKRGGIKFWPSHPVLIQALDRSLSDMGQEKLSSWDRLNKIIFKISVPLSLK